MSGSKYFLDTNAILYILGGDEALTEMLYNERLFTSIITEIELLSYKNITVREKRQISKFLFGF